VGRPMSARSARGDDFRPCVIRNGPAPTNNALARFSANVVNAASISGSDLGRMCAASAHRQDDRHRCGSAARGARRTPRRSLDSDASSDTRPGRPWRLLLRRRRPRCRHCGPLPDVSSGTLFRSSIMRPSPSPESMTENGRRPHEMKVRRGRSGCEGSRDSLRTRLSMS